MAEYSEVITASDFVNHFTSHTGTIDGLTTKYNYFRGYAYELLSITYGSENYEYSGAVTEDYFNTSGLYFDYIYIPANWISLHGYAVHKSDWETELIVYYYETESVVIPDSDTDTTISLNTEEIIKISSVNSECPYSYKLYYKLISDVNIAYLSILKSSSVVFDEALYNFIGVDIVISDNGTKDYAQNKLDEYVNDCIANLKIKTTCCLLVCCEPDKYELI